MRYVETGHLPHLDEANDWWVMAESLGDSNIKMYNLTGYLNRLAQARMEGSADWAVSAALRQAVLKAFDPRWVINGHVYANDFHSLNNDQSIGKRYLEPVEIWSQEFDFGFGKFFHDKYGYSPLTVPDEIFEQLPEWLNLVKLEQDEVEEWWRKDAEAKGVNYFNAYTVQDDWVVFDAPGGLYVSTEAPETSPVHLTAEGLALCACCRPIWEQVGRVASGTPEDIARELAEAMAYFNMARGRELEEEVEESLVVDDDEYGQHELYELHDSIMNELDAYALPGVFFGHHESDGEIGFWYLDPTGIW